MQDEQSERSVYIKIVFRNDDAAYYQFHVFPFVDSSEDLCLSRKRKGDSQYLRIYYRDHAQMHEFVRNLRHNPHVVDIQETTQTEFASAHSDAV